MCTAASECARWRRASSPLAQVTGEESVEGASAKTSTWKGGSISSYPGGRRAALIAGEIALRRKNDASCFMRSILIACNTSAKGGKWHPVSFFYGDSIFTFFAKYVSSPFIGGALKAKKREKCETREPQHVAICPCLYRFGRIEER